MELKTVNHSYYPKIGERDEQHELRRAFHFFDRKKISESQLREAHEHTVKVVIGEQEAHDLDVITDGLIWWNDPVSHIMSSLEGVRMAGLLRFFDTNFYFRQPLIVGKLKRKGSMLSQEISFLKKQTKSLTKAVLTGPYTLSLLSQLDTTAYASPEAVADALTDILSEEIQELALLGIDTIQIDEPMFLTKPPKWKWAEKSLLKLMQHRKKTKLGLVTYFGDAVPFYSELQHLPVDFLGFDFTYSSKLTDTLQKLGTDKDLQLGLLDGRNTKLEDLKEIFTLLEKVGPVLQGKTSYVTTSCGLEYLPRDRAMDKLYLLKTIKHEFQKRK